MTSYNQYFKDWLSIVRGVEESLKEVDDQVEPVNDINDIVSYVSCSKSVTVKTVADAEKLKECTATGHVFVAVHKDDLQAILDFKKLLANVKKTKENV